MILKNLPATCRVNVIKFGSSYQELFVQEQLVGNESTKTKAEDFIQVFYGLRFLVVNFFSIIVTLSNLNSE